MATAWDTKFLEEAGACAAETAPKRAGSSTRPKTCVGSSSNEREDITRSSPPVLEPSKDESRSEDGRRKPSLLRRILTRSLNFEPSETTPLVTGGQMNGHVEESGPNCCSKLYNFYKTSVVFIRNSVFLQILQILFLSIPISAVVMGVIFAQNCPKVYFLPVYGAVVGAIGAVFMALWMYVTCINLHGQPSSSRTRLLLAAALFVVVVIGVVDAVFIFDLSPSSDPSSSEYCNETFYTYAFYKEIASAAIAVLSAIIYLPGSRHVLCCNNCVMRPPPNAFYYSI